MSSGAIWIVGIYISVLRLLNVKIVVMSIYWHFLAKEDITDVVIENMMNPHRPARMIT